MSRSIANNAYNSINYDANFNLDKKLENQLKIPVLKRKKNTVKFSKTPS